MLVANVASFVTGVFVISRRFPPPISRQAPLFNAFAQTAIDTFERDGRSGLVSYFDRMESTSQINGVLLDDRGDELSGRSLPNGTKDFAQRVAKASGSLFEFPNGRARPLVGTPVRSRSGALYVVVAELPKSDFPGPPRFGERGSMRFGLLIAGQTLLPLLLIGILFSYLLAKHLSTPIVKLRGATHELSEGNLNARVDERLFKRHDEIGYLSRDFNLMASRVESLVGAQRRLLGDISHELRSPLARLGVALGLAQRRGGPEVKTALDRIEREATRMNDMLGNLLTLSRIEGGTDGLDKVEIELATLVQEIADDTDFEAQDRGCSVHVVDSRPSTVIGIRELLWSAIENVVRNAVRHTTSGTTVEIGLISDTATDHAVITVRDHGKGVPDDALEQIFRPFYRVEHARDRMTGGTGLGLAIAAYAVRLHKGTVKAVNAAGGGLLVEIRLPLKNSALGEIGTISSA